MYEKSYYYGQHVITTYFSSSTSKFFLYLLTWISEGGEWSSELHSEENWIQRINLTPDFFVSGKVKLFKIIKKDCNMYH